MSTNKTPNYQLHSWTPEDEFHVSEINENFEKLDASAVRILFGSYTATEKNLTVELGAYVKALVIFYRGGAVGNSNAAYATMAVRGKSSSGVTLTDTGFTVAYSNSVLPGFSGWTYNYVALV